MAFRTRLCSKMYILKLTSVSNDPILTLFLESLFTNPFHYSIFGCASISRIYFPKLVGDWVDRNFELTHLQSSWACSTGKALAAVLKRPAFEEEENETFSRQLQESFLKVRPYDDKEAEEYKMVLYRFAERCSFHLSDIQASLVWSGLSEYDYVWQNLIWFGVRGKGTHLWRALVW